MLLLINDNMIRIDGNLDLFVENRLEVFRILDRIFKRTSFARNSDIIIELFLKSCSIAFGASTALTKRVNDRLSLFFSFSQLIFKRINCLISTPKNTLFHSSKLFRTYTLRVYAPAEVKPTVHRTDPRMIASVLEETEDEVAVSVPVTVESNREMYDADLGFVCRKPGVLPADAGIGRKILWSQE